jgi:hypothetical protein
MASNPGDRLLSQFGVMLQNGRRIAGLSIEQLAERMIANGFPSHQNSQQDHDRLQDRAFLAGHIRAIETATVSDPWPFAPLTIEFTDPAARSLAGVFEIARCLDMAMALDVLVRASLSLPDPPA